MRDQTCFPLNLPRESTPVPDRSGLREQDRLLGDYHGYTYRIANPRVQQAYEMFREVFSPRNFLVEGMNHQTMRVDYYYHLLSHFHPELASGALRKQVKGLVAELNVDNAELLGAICDFVGAARVPGELEIEARTQALSLARVAFDEQMQPRVEALLKTMRGLAEQARRPRTISRVVAMAAAGLVASTLGCGSPQDTHMAEMAPEDPCMIPRELSQEETGHLTGFVQERHLAELSQVLRRHGQPGEVVELDLALRQGGAVEQASIAQLPNASAELQQLTRGWQLPVTCAAFARLELTVPAGDDNAVLRPVDPDPIDTHMAEMAPLDPIDTTWPRWCHRHHHRHRRLPLKGPSTTGRRRAAGAHRPAGTDLSLLARSTGSASERHARLLLHPDGHSSSERDLAGRPGSGAYAERPGSLLGSRSSDLRFAGEGSVLCAGRLPRPPDTHMAEMAPRDPGLSTTLAGDAARLWVVRVYAR